MKTNPGGQVDLDYVVGRDELINNIWSVLEQQSIQMTAERRIGKTTIMKKMQAEPPEGWVPIFQDLEQYSSAAQFAMSVYREVQTHLSKKQKMANRTRDLLKNLGGTEIGGLFRLPEQADIPWKNILTSSITDLVLQQEEGNKKVVFLWDEMPYMLLHIRDNDSEATAMQVLDILRASRQTHRSFRMLMTGSIGLHHVLGDLKSRGYGNAPVNDLFLVEVPPLSKKDAEQLAADLLAGEKVSVDEVETKATIAELADNFPFYIHHIVRALKLRQEAATAEKVEEIVLEQLTDTNDPWQLRHYEERIATYYREHAGTVKLILDDLTTKETPQSSRELLATLKSQSDFDDLEQLRTLLQQMGQDHYLQRDSDNKYSFRFSLIGRWWKLERDLT